MVDDVLSLYIVRAIAAVILTNQDKHISVFNNNGFQEHAPSWYQETLENIDIFYVSWQKFSMIEYS